MARAKKTTRAVSKRRASDVSVTHGASDTHVRNPKGALAALPPKRQKFVLAFCRPTTRAKDLGNATAAATAAGYGAAAETGHKLRHDPRVQAAIEEVMAELRKEHATIARRALAELEAAALANITDILKIAPGAICLRDDIPPEAWAAVQEITDHPEQGLKVKMAGKAPLLALLLKATGFLAPDKGPTVAVGVAVNGELRPTGTALSSEERERVREALGIPSAAVDIAVGGEA